MQQALRRIVTSYAAGRGLQELMGSRPNHDTEGSGDTDTSGTTGGLPSTYRGEQQSNEYMPEGQPFMGLGFWGAGNLVAPHLPTPVLRESVANLSAPSNPHAYRNRQAVAALPGMIGTAAGFMNPWARPLAALGQSASGFLLGTEHQAESQSRATPRLPPNPAVHTDPGQLASDYAEVSSQYQDAGYPSQSRVTSVIPPHPANAQVSHSIHGRLLPQYDSPFIRDEQTGDK